MKNIANVCHEYQIPVIENDFLRDISGNSQLIPPPMKTIIPNDVIYIGSLINSNINGFKTAYIAVPNEALERICEIKSHLFTGNHNGCEAVINEMLEKGYYYKWLDKFQGKLQLHIYEINKILNKHLKILLNGTQTT